MITNYDCATTFSPEFPNGGRPHSIGLAATLLQT